MPKSKKALTPWEIAKPILQQYCVEDGSILDTMKPSDVWELRPEFKAVKYNNFRNNFAAMKRSLKKDRARNAVDEAGFLHDKSLYTLAKDMDGYWDGSKAQELLKWDIENKVYLQMKPSSLWQSRPEYQKFKLEKFRNHIQQELRRERETNYWIVKKKKKKKKKAVEAKQNNEIMNDEDVDFLRDPLLVNMWNN